jgi:hypothetical protein
LVPCADGSSLLSSMYSVLGTISTTSDASKLWMVNKTQKKREERQTWDGTGGKASMASNRHCSSSFSGGASAVLAGCEVLDGNRLTVTLDALFIEENKQSKHAPL